MPAWHSREREFRDWYIALAENFRNVDGPAVYERYVRALRCVEPVKGYREIRYPKMDEAKRKAEELLKPSSAPVAKSVAHVSI
jgi:indolepyruvate ferredoxin oxidoreductase